MTSRPEESSGGVSRQVAAVLDIGRGVGALVVYTGAHFAGAEIEVTPLTPGATGTHSVVHPRRVPGRGDVHAAVFPALAPGVYSISTADLGVCDEASINEGCVTETTLGTA